MQLTSLLLLSGCTAIYTVLKTVMCGGSRKASDSQKEKNGKKEREEPNKRNVHYPYLSFACRKKKMSRRPTVI